MHMHNQPSIMPKTFELRPYKLKELAGFYNISKDTFRRQLKLLEPKIGTRAGHYYNIAQVKIIIEHLGKPGTGIFDEI